VIKKLRQRSQFRKPDKLKTFHYNLINDQSFFKNRAITKDTDSLDLTNNRDKSEKKIKVLVFSKIKKNLKQVVKKILKEIPILKSNSNIKLIWDSLILLLAIFEFMMISLELTFSMSFEIEFQTGIFFKLGSFLFFLINILMNFNTTYYEYGVAVKSRKKIVLNYLKTTFPYDFLSLFFLIPNIVHSLDYPSLSIFSIGFLLIYKTLNKIIENLEETYELSGDFFDLCSLLFKTLCIAHILACCWHAIGFFLAEGHSSWLNIDRFIDLNWNQRYLVSLYWAFTTMCTVGYGDITPQNSAEMGYCCFVMLIGTFGLGYCVNSVGILLSRIQEKSKEMNENMKIVDNFMKRKNINLQLRVKVKRYLEFLWKSQNKTIEKEAEILEKLPIKLKHEILRESNSKFLKDFPLLSNNFSIEFLEFLALNIKPIQYSPTDFIYTQDSISDPSLFLIFEGEIELFIEKTIKKPLALKLLSKGHSFGEHSFFLDLAHNENARSMGFSTIYKIARNEFLEYLAGFPKDYQRFCEIKDKGRFNENNESLVGCLSCNKSNHSIDNCPLLTYCPDKTFLIERLNFSRPQKRLVFSRKTKKKNTFKDKKTVLRSVMQVRFNKSLMNIYYGTFNWSQDLKVLDEIPEKNEKFMELSIPIRAKSLDHIKENSPIEKEIPRIRFYSMASDLDSSGNDTFGKKGAQTRKSFCPNKEDINKMFNKEDLQEEEEKNHEVFSGILRKKTDKVSEGKTHVNFEDESLEKIHEDSEDFHVKKKPIFLNTLASKEQVDYEDFKEKTEALNKKASQKSSDGRISFDSSFPRKWTNKAISSPLVRDEESKDNGNTGNISPWKKTLKKLDLWKKTNVQQINMNPKASKSLEKDEDYSMELKSQKTNMTTTSKRRKTLDSKKFITILKDEEDILKNSEKKAGNWLKTMYWMEFENMKEFELYFKHNNMSSVINKIDMEMSEKLINAKKNKNKTPSPTKRKEIFFK